MCVCVFVCLCVCVCIEILRECVCKEKEIERIYLIVRLFVRYVCREIERERGGMCKEME